LKVQGQPGQLIETLSQILKGLGCNSVEACLTCTRPWVQSRAQTVMTQIVKEDFKFYNPAQDSKMSMGPGFRKVTLAYL
jgi:hypothetical protein